MSIIYPPKCGFCGKIGKTYLCKKCEISLKKEYFLEENVYDDKYFEKHISIFRYGGKIRDLILRYKFKDSAYLYRTLSYFFKDIKYLKEKNYDMIIPVPISNKRYKERGYNQSYLISKEISKILNIEVNKNVIKKIKNNSAQSTSNKENREQNVKGIYEINNKEKNKIINKNILLIDDIFTTGATVNECSKVLIQNGAKKIDIFTIAKD